MAELDRSWWNKLKTLLLLPLRNQANQAYNATIKFLTEQRMDATARAIDEYCKNPFEGVASFPVLREFQSPCACGTATQDVDIVVQCPSCGICYKVTQKRQLLSLQKSRYSAISVSPTTIFWCTLWCTIGIGCLIGGMSFLQTTGNFVTTGADLRSAIFLLTMGVWIGCVMVRMLFHWLMEKYLEATTMVSVDVILDSEGEWEVSPAPKPLATKPDSDGSALQSTIPTHDDNAAKFGFSRPAQSEHQMHAELLWEQIPCNGVNSHQRNGSLTSTRWVSQAAGSSGGGEGEEGSDKSTPRVQLQSQKQQQTESPVRSDAVLRNSWTSSGFEEDSEYFENVASETLRSSDLQQQQQAFETLNMPGYVPSPNSNRSVSFSTLSQTSKSVAVAAAVPSIPISTTLSNNHHLKPSNQSANDAPANHDREHSDPRESQKNMLSNSHCDIGPTQPSSAQRLGSSNAFEHQMPLLVPAPAATATVSLDENPALRLGQDEDPSVIKSILEDLRAWDTATQLKSSMQKHTNDGLATENSTRSESSAVSAISKRPQTAVQRERTAVGNKGITRPTSAAPAFVRQELFVDEQNVKDEDEQHEEMDNTTLRGASLSALSLFDGKEDGNGGAAQGTHSLSSSTTVQTPSVLPSSAAPMKPVRRLLGPSRPTAPSSAP